MSNPAIDGHCDAPDPAWKPIDLTDLFSKIDQRLRIAFATDNSYIPYLVSSTTPSVDDQDKIWVKLDNLGNPLGNFIFVRGNWRLIYTGRIGEVKIFIGDPSVPFDTNGRGVVGGLWDGWQIMNGKGSSTADWSDHFICGAHMNNTGGLSGYGTNWQTGVTGVGLSEGGSAYSQLYLNHIPSLPTPGIVAGSWKADSNARDASGQLYGLVGTSTDHSFTLLEATPGNPEPGDAFLTVSPFKAACFVQFIGYTYD
jgi:hypothetical protein